MFERFTERSRQVVVYAQDEALALKHNYIGTEHILLGLLRENEGLAARVLGSLDVTVDEVRTQVERRSGDRTDVLHWLKKLFRPAKVDYRADPDRHNPVVPVGPPTSGPAPAQELDTAATDPARE